ncbi:serine hydrolase [bacterium]|nr:serine hydrolase [bacterium]
MYAYKQYAQVQSVQALPQRYATPQRVVRKRVKPRKKKNWFLEFFRLSVTLSFLSAFIYFVSPTAYHGLVKQVFYPFDWKIETEYPSTMLVENPAFSTSLNMQNIAYPVNNYLSNDMFQNTLLLTPTIQKTHSEVTTMYQTSEMLDLKNELIALKNQYPTIKPSVYVWEYEQGRYVDLNSEELYPAASIIKIPVLVRMFKSIEANQFTIYDEMKMTEQYRSSGSGNLQYSQAGRMYSMDYLAKIMIEDSDNTSTNMIMSKIGGMDDVNIGLRDWGISKTYVRTWLPDLKGTNKTTAADMAKILYNLDNPGFLNINSREYIIDYMSHVKNDRLIKAGLGEGAIFVHKTGDIGTMLGDAGIVYAPNGKKYIVVILANRPHNAPQGKEFIVKASSLIYKKIIGE